MRYILLQPKSAEKKAWPDVLPESPELPNSERTVAVFANCVHRLWLWTCPAAKFHRGFVIYLAKFQRDPANNCSGILNHRRFSTLCVEIGQSPFAIMMT